MNFPLFFERQSYNLCRLKLRGSTILSYTTNVEQKTVAYSFMHSENLVEWPKERGHSDAPK